MKLRTNPPFGKPGGEVDAGQAVNYVVNRAAGNYDDVPARAAARHDAVQEMFGRLLQCMIDNGALRAAQVSTIFDYDAIAEEG